MSKGDIPPHDFKWEKIAIDNTILRCLVGSESYGISLGESSDRDELGVALEPMEARLTLSGNFDFYEYRSAAEREGKRNAKSKAGDLDLKIYSLESFLRLALKGNPSVIELLYIPHPIVLTPEGRELQLLAPHLISQRCGRAYLGFAQQQKERMLGQRGQKDVNRPELVEKYGFDTKFAGHVVRLYVQGYELVTTGKLTLPIENDSIRQRIIDIRTGKYDLEYVTSYSNTREGMLKGALDKTSLAEYPNVSLVEDWMREKYRSKWNLKEI